MRYRFKGIVRTTGQSVEGHAHGDSPEEAYAALSEHGIVTESLREEPEALNLTQTQNQPLTSAIDSALDTAAAQVPFESIANKYKGKSVWVIDRDKIRKRVAQVVDTALREALSNTPQSGSIDATDLRAQVQDAIGGLFKDNRNLTSQVSDNALKMDHQVRRIEQMVQRAESVLAQMTIAISKIGSGGGWGGGGGGPRRALTKSSGGGEQNSVLLEIFKENLKLRGIVIDENPPSAEGATSEGAAGESAPTDSNAGNNEAPAQSALSDDSGPQRIQRPASPISAEASSPGQFNSNSDVELTPDNNRGES